MMPTPSPSSSTILLKTYPSSWILAATSLSSSAPAATSAATATPSLLLPFLSPNHHHTPEFSSVPTQMRSNSQKYNVNSRCQDYALNFNTCRQLCPSYLIPYGSDSTNDIALVETLDLSGRKVFNFVISCSLFSSHQFAGFDCGSSLLSSQIDLKKLSFKNEYRPPYSHDPLTEKEKGRTRGYYLLSHRFDDSHESSLTFFDSRFQSHIAGNLSYSSQIKNTIDEKYAFCLLLRGSPQNQYILER